MASDKKPLHVEVAEQLIEALRAGTAPWQKPWRNDGLPAFQLPYNVVTGNRYKGINILSLTMRGKEDPRWLTFNQAKDNGWQVRKGAKAAPIQYVKMTEERTKRDAQGKVEKDAQGKPVKITVKLERPMIISAWVFNADQVEGMPELDKPVIKELGWEPLERAEQLINATGADIRHVQGRRAYYAPGSDRITLPLRAQFNEPAKYYATALHELGHWTGHTTRLDRSLINTFGTEGYAREELRAEIASMLIGQELHIGHDPGQHAAYVDSWISILTDHPFEIHSAAADAEKIFNYLLDFERKREVVNELAEVRLPSMQKYLSTGDEIDYQNTTYRVAGHLKRGRIIIEDTQKGHQFAISRKDQLYGSLLQARERQLTETFKALPVSPEQAVPMLAGPQEHLYSPINAKMKQENLLEMLPVADLEKVGLYKDGQVLLSEGNLNALLSGRRTELISLRDLKADGFDLDQLDAKLSVVPDFNNKLSLKIHPIYKEPKLHPMLNEHEAEVLISGQIDTLQKIYDKAGNRKAYAFEYDPETKEFVNYDPDKIPVPLTINNEELTDRQKDAFKNGEIITLGDGTQVQHRASASTGLRADLAVLAISVMLDGGISYLIIRGIKALVDRRQKETEAESYLKALGALNRQLKAAGKPLIDPDQQEKRGYTKTRSR